MYVMHMGSSQHQACTHGLGCWVDSAMASQCIYQCQFVVSHNQLDLLNAELPMTCSKGNG